MSLIIGDNSKQEFINYSDFSLINTEVIQSGFPKRGELLAYHYFLKLKPFDKDISIILLLSQLCLEWVSI